MINTKDMKNIEYFRNNSFHGLSRSSLSVDCEIAKKCQRGQNRSNQTVYMAASRQIANELPTEINIFEKLKDKDG